jgi:pteridine reductase
MELENKVALVTGAAHRVGRAIALELARRGCGVILHYGRSRDAARDTAEEIRGRGVPCWLAPADLADPAEIDDLFDRLRGDRMSGEAPRLDVLVNSAARFESRAFGEITVEDWDAVLAVNLRAPFLLTQRAAAWMGASPRPEGESGLVVNLADLAGIQTWRGFTHHGVSKAGLLHLTRLAARELAPAVRVNAIVPGAILPPPGTDESDELWREIRERIPLGRTGSPELVAHTVVYLAENEFVTGAVVPLDGGERLTAVRDVSREPSRGSRRPAGDERAARRTD